MYRLLNKGLIGDPCVLRTEWFASTPKTRNWGRLRQSTL